VRGRRACPSWVFRCESGYRRQVLIRESTSHSSDDNPVRGGSRARVFGCRKAGLTRCSKACATGWACSFRLPERRVGTRRKTATRSSRFGWCTNGFSSHMIVFRHADPRFPFLWESKLQPPGRWHRTGEGPVQYFADTPDGAWAEFLRHEGIRTENEIANVRRARWAVEIPDDPSAARPLLPSAVMTGGIDSYARCQEESGRLRVGGQRCYLLLPRHYCRERRVDGRLKVASGPGVPGVD
jgi:hypothetical protein